VTLKTGIMMLKIHFISMVHCRHSSCKVTYTVVTKWTIKINKVLKYIQIENS